MRRDRGVRMLKRALGHQMHKAEGRAFDMMRRKLKEHKVRPRPLSRLARYPARSGEEW